MEIGTFVDMLLCSRKMTMSELAEKLGYRSRTSIIRLLRGEINRRSLDSFAARLESQMSLTVQERRALDEVMEMQRWQERYPAVCEMRAFLQGEQPAAAELMLDAGSDGEQTLSGRYRGARQMKIVLLNSGYTHIFGALQQLIRGQGAVVEHYMTEDRDAARTIHAVKALMPVAFENGYSGYTRGPVPGEMPGGLAQADAMTVEYVRPDGGYAEELVLFDAPDRGRVIPLTVRGTARRLMQLPEEEFAPVKRTYFQCSAMEDYIRYSSDYAALEENCVMYSLKPDLSLCFVPVDILKAAFLDQSGPVDDAVMDALVQIYARRYDNIFKSRSISHVIMKRSAMRQFARTGRSTDHFWGMRPYTPQERRIILSNMVVQMETNPRFNVYFLKDNREVRDLEMTWYEGRGLLVLNANTDYDLAGGHSEVLVTHPHFLSLFRDYVVGSLLSDCVISHQETMSFMRMLIEDCENMM